MVPKMGKNGTVSEKGKKAGGMAGEGWRCPINKHLSQNWDGLSWRCETDCQGIPLYTLSIP
jgi:hypothetical protein